MAPKERGYTGWRPDCKAARLDWPRAAAMTAGRFERAQEPGEIAAWTVLLSFRARDRRPSVWG